MKKIVCLCALTIFLALAYVSVEKSASNKEHMERGVSQRENGRGATDVLSVTDQEVENREVADSTSEIDELTFEVMRRLEQAAKESELAFEHDILPEMSWLTPPTGYTLRDCLESPDGQHTAFLVCSTQKVSPRPMKIEVLSKVSGEWLEIETPNDVRSADILDMTWDPYSGDLLFRDKYATLPLPEIDGEEFGSLSGEGRKRLREEYNTDMVAYNESTHQTIWRWDSATGSVKKVYALGSQHVYDMVGTKDSEVIVCTGNAKSSKELDVVRIRPGRSIEVGTHAVGNIRNAYVLADANVVLYSSYASEDDAYSTRPGDIGLIGLNGSDAGPVVIMKGKTILAMSGNGKLGLLQGASSELDPLLWEVGSDETIPLFPKSRLPQPVALSYSGDKLFSRGVKSGYLSGREVLQGQLVSKMGLFEMPLNRIK